MKLLGKRNWYLPPWLHWLPDVRVEGAEAAVVVDGSPSSSTPTVVDVSDTAGAAAPQEVEAGT